MSDVTWLPIPGADSYEASSDGQIRSIDRQIVRADGNVKNLKGRLIKQSANPRDGYMQVAITFNHGKASTRVHKLICMAFHGQSPSSLHEVRHLNGIRDDNRAENLCWGTKSENQYDRVRHGNHFLANKTHCDNGHLLDEICKSGTRRYRRCSTCRRERAAQFRAEQPERVREYSQRQEAKRRSDPEWREKRRQRDRERRAEKRAQIKRLENS